jgi:ADP-ribose pyrophosphatase YjhB (NUDIX family)
MHHIQAKILRKLLYASTLHYAAMRPDSVESNHFAYHLEQLLKAGLVRKTGKDYSLSPQGLAYVDRLSQTKMTNRLQPHIITAIDLTTPTGETLLFKRHFQPYLRLAGFPLGKLHYEEPVLEGAVRELAEKTGLRGIPLQHRGMAYIQARSEGITIGHVLYHVFHGEAPVPLPTTTPHERGECFWADYHTIDPALLMPGFLGVKELLATSTNLFFEEIIADL